MLHHHRIALIISGSFLQFSDLDANDDFLICRTTAAVVNLKVSAVIPPLIFPTVVSASNPLYFISLLEIRRAVSLSLPRSSDLSHFSRVPLCVTP